MVEKQGFFNLDTKFQTRLRYYIAILAILQTLGFLIVSQTMSLVSMILGIGLNLLLLYFSFSITRAPRLYFQFILWSFWFVLIFSGLDIYNAISNQQLFTPISILAFLSIALIIGISPTLTKYRTSISEAKKVTIIP